MADMSRGVLTDEVKAVAVAFLNREIGTSELRFYPYIDYCIKNQERLARINDEERAILEELEKGGHLYYHGGRVFVSPEFYDYLQSILKISYVGFDEFNAFKQVVKADE